jgi:hypothetical protein
MEFATLTFDFSQFNGFMYGLIGASFGAWIANRFTESRRRREEFEKAAIAFRNAFLPEIIYFKHNAKVTGAGSSNNLCELLRAAYIHRHLKAFETFRMYLPPRDQEKFEKAWKEYCRFDVPGEPERPFFEMYYEKTWEGQPTKELALQRINKLLSFMEV